LVALAWQRSESPYELVLAANRDELFARPTALLAHWSDAPDVVGGRDLEKGGSWLALRRDGRFALVTNVRDFRRSRLGSAWSRGEIVRRAVTSAESPSEVLDGLRTERENYEPFNVLVGDRRSLAWHSSETGEVRVLGPGVYGLSNALLDTPWPKVLALRAALERVMDLKVEEIERTLFAALASEARAPSEALPDTGVGPEIESALSPAFVHVGGFGTRSSSVITVTRAGHARFVERTFDQKGALTATTALAMSIER